MLAAMQTQPSEMHWDERLWWYAYC